LTDRLPKSNYQNGYEYESNKKMNQSAKGKNEIKPSMHQNSKANINLPKLDRILIKGSNPKNNLLHLHEKEKPLYLQPKASKVDINDLLKIEGKSNNPRYNYEY
jgi:hypothetical protein